ALLDSLFLR
ncbi:hypothetical protein AVEN_271503-1, partial [Araneus ventricosus]